MGMAPRRASLSGILSATANNSGEKMSKSGNPSDSILLEGAYIPTAAYYLDSDCVEYVKRDCSVIYDRIDEFLTLIMDIEKNIIGFKLKGFKHVYEQRLLSQSRFLGLEFVHLVSAIESLVNSLGEKFIEEANERRTKAYRAAYNLAANDNVHLSVDFLNKANRAA